MCRSTPARAWSRRLRTAIGERIAREFIDLETPRFEAVTGVFPDPYALKRVTSRAFRAAAPAGDPASAARAAQRANRLDGQRGCTNWNPAIA